MLDFTIQTQDRTYLSRDIERAGLSYVPCSEKSPLFPYKHLWGEKEQIRILDFPFSDNSLDGMTGIQVFTGPPTWKVVDGTSYFLVDLDVERALVDRHPDVVDAIIGLYRAYIKGHPCITWTKSGGWRLSGFVNYGGGKVFWRDRDDEKVLLEVFGKHGMSRYDQRYRIYQGCLLEIPLLDIAVFPFIRELMEPIGTRETLRMQRTVVSKGAIGDLDISWSDKTMRDGTPILQSQLIPTSHCPLTEHASNRNEIRFTKYQNGTVDGICFNCGETWWEVKPQKSYNRQQSRRIRSSFDDNVQKHKLHGGLL